MDFFCSRGWMRSARRDCSSFWVYFVEVANANNGSIAELRSTGGWRMKITKSDIICNKATKNKHDNDSKASNRLNKKAIPHQQSACFAFRSCRQPTIIYAVPISKPTQSAWKPQGSHRGTRRFTEGLDCLIWTSRKTQRQVWNRFLRQLLSQKCLEAVLEAY